MRVITPAQRLGELQAVIHKRGALLDVGCGNLNHKTLDSVVEVGNYSSITCLDPHLLTVQNRIAWSAGHQCPMYFSLAKVEEVQFDRRFDVVLMSHVIEHIKFADAVRVVRYLSSLCDVQFLVETPNEFEDGSGAVREFNNEFHKHVSLFGPEEMHGLGFREVFMYTQPSGLSNTMYVRDMVTK